MKHIIDRQPSWVIQTVFGYVISKLLVFSLKLSKMAQVAEIRLGTPPLVCLENFLVLAVYLDRSSSVGTCCFEWDTWSFKFWIKSQFLTGFCGTCFQLRLQLICPLSCGLDCRGLGWSHACPCHSQGTSSVDHIVPNIYSGYKMSLHYLLNRIMEQWLTQGRNLGGILEKGEKRWTNLPIAQFPCVLGYLSRSS